MPRLKLASLGRLLLIVWVNLSCTTATPPPAPTPRQSKIELTSCKFANLKEAALCGKHVVYEDRGAKAGRTIALSIVVLPATGTAPLPDPIFYLTGGPGQGAALIANTGGPALTRELRRDRDVVLVDMRGTGDSNRLQCPSRSDPARLQNYFAEIFEPSAIRACRQALERIADLSRYTTPLAMEDLEDIRAALGYEQINLSGVSYGTLAALEYLRRQPQRVRTVTLAGVITPAAKLPLHFAKGGQLALDRLFNDCAAEPTCRKNFPGLRAQFAALVASFDQAPLHIEMAHPNGKIVEKVRLSRAIFAERLRGLLTTHEQLRLVPLAIQRAAAGDWSVFAAIALTGVTPSIFGIATGLYYSVTCTETVPAISDEDIIRENLPTFLGDYRTLRHREACSQWPRGELPADYSEPVQSPVPVLMLSGDIDPATPPEIGNAALQFLPNGRQVVLRNTPHTYTSECARNLMAEFIAKGSAKELTVACAARLRRPPFLTELPERYKPKAAGAKNSPK